MSKNIPPILSHFLSGLFLFLMDLLLKKIIVFALKVFCVSNGHLRSYSPQLFVLLVSFAVGFSPSEKFGLWCYFSRLIPHNLSGVLSFFFFSLWEVIEFR